jgi:hypothetical protein
MRHAQWTLGACEFGGSWADGALWQVCLVHARDGAVVRVARVAEMRGAEAEPHSDAAAVAALEF